MYIYVAGSLGIHGLNLRNDDEIEQLRLRIERLLVTDLDLEHDSDVNFEIDEKAGTPEPEL